MIEKAVAVFALAFMLSMFADPLANGIPNKMTVNPIGSDLDISEKILLERPFVENLGQWDTEIIFEGETSFGQVALGNGCIYYNVLDTTRSSSIKRPLGNTKGIHSMDREDMVLRGSVIKLEFVGSNPTVPVGSGLLGTNTNYFLGNDPSRWASDVPSYEKIEYTDIWDGISIVFYLSEGGLKYNIYIEPGSDPADISFMVSGQSDMSIIDGILSILAPTGQRINDGGLAANYIDGEKESIEVAFRLISDGIYGFKMSGMDRSRPILIDPLVFSTYYGGTNADEPYDIVQDGNGNSYITGYTASTDFPITPGIYQSSNKGGWDAFVSKINNGATAKTYSTYIGGSYDEEASGITIDTNGNAYVTGWTYSIDFPVTSGAYNETHWGDSSYLDIFVFKLNPTGSNLVFSTYVSGEYDDFGDDISIDGYGNSYICGITDSSNFPVTSGAYDESYNENTDMVLFQLSSDGTDLRYSTFIGGFDWETASSLFFRSQDAIYLTGSTMSYDFPITTGASLVDMADVVVLKIDIGNSTLIYSTLFGGDGDEEGISITVDGSGDTFVCGYTTGGSRMIFPTTNGAYDKSFNGGYLDMFATHLDSTGSTLLYSTFIGGSKNDAAVGIKIESQGNAYITGATESSDFPTTPGALYTSYQGGNADAIVLKLDSSGSSLLYSTYLGGSDDDFTYNIFLDTTSKPTIVGTTNSKNFPTTPGVISTTIMGGGDCFITKLEFTSVPTVPQDLNVIGGEGFIQLDWSPPLSDGGASILHYSIYKGPSETSLDKLAMSSIPSYNDTSVIAGTVYYYAVSANNSVGESPKTPAVNALPIGVPAPPQNVNATVALSSVTITWEPPSFTGGIPVNSFRIYKGTVSGLLTQLVQVGMGTNQFVDTSVQLGATYYYQVTALNLVGESPRSPELIRTMPDVPSSPINFSAVSGDEFVLLSWEVPSSNGGLFITGFNLYRGEEDTEKNHLQSLAQNVLSFNDTTVVNGVAYVYNITAVNNAGESVPSTYSATPLSVPQAPQTVMAAGGDEVIHLTWEPPSDDGGTDITGYRIFSGNASGFEEFVQEVAGDVHEFNHSGLENGIEYFYYLKAVNNVGESMRSQGVSAVPLGLPDPPTDLTAQANDGYVLLTWKAPMYTGGLPISVYNVMRGSTWGNYDDFETVGSTSGLSTNDSTVENGELYFYVVRAQTSIGFSIWSNEVSASPIGKPSAPTEFTATAGNGNVSLSWWTPMNSGGTIISGYRIYRGEDRLVLPLLKNVSGTIYFDDNVTNGITYYYYITAFNSVGESEPTETKQVKPLGPPSAPKNVVAIEFEGFVKISWEAPDDTGGSAIIGYSIYRSDDGGEFVHIGNTAAGITTYIDETVKEDVKYDYLVRAKTVVGEGIPSTTVSIEIKEDAVGFNIGLIIGIVVGALLLLLVIAIVLFLVLKKKKPAEVPPPSTQPQMIPPGYLYPQIPMAPTAQIYPLDAPPQQGVMPPAPPAQALPATTQLEPISQQTGEVSLGSVGPPIQESSLKPVQSIEQVQEPIPSNPQQDPPRVDNVPPA